METDHEKALREQVDNLHKEVAALTDERFEKIRDANALQAQIGALQAELAETRLLAARRGEENARLRHVISELDIAVDRFNADLAKLKTSVGL